MQNNNSNNYNSDIPRFEFYNGGKELINDVNILEVFQRFTNVDVSKALNSNISCPRPSHQDKKPSTRIYPKTNTCHCFGCQQSWNSLTLYAEMTNQSLEGSSFVTTMKSFADTFGLDWKNPKYSNFEERESIREQIYGHRGSEPQFFDRLVLTGSDMNFLGLYDDRANGLILSEEWKSNKTDVEEGVFELINCKFQEVALTLADTLDIIVSYEKNFDTKTEKGIKENYNSGVKNLLENPNYWINTTQLHERLENKVKNDVAEKFDIKPDEIKQRINNYNSYLKQFEIAKKAGNDVLRCYDLAQNLVNNCMKREAYCEAVHKQYEGLDLKNLNELPADILFQSQANYYQRFDFEKIFGFQGLGFDEVIKDCKEKEIEEKEEVSALEENAEKDTETWDKEDM